MLLWRLTADEGTFHIIKVLLPTDAQESYFKRSIKIYIQTAPTFGFHGSVHHVDCSKWNQRDAVQQVFIAP